MEKFKSEYNSLEELIKAFLSHRDSTHAVNLWLMSPENFKIELLDAKLVNDNQLFIAEVFINHITEGRIAFYKFSFYLGDPLMYAQIMCAGLVIPLDRWGKEFKYHINKHFKLEN